MTRTWFITGASRGLGADIAHAALTNGDRVVATGRSRDAVSRAVGPDSETVLTATLDVTEPSQAEAAVAAAVARFGGIDVLVNNAGYGHLGLFEETTRQDAEAQFATNFFGALNVTRAALPVMRAARSGHIFNISSIAGVRGSEGGSLYCSSKFALEGFSESLAKEVAAFGLFVTIVEPGFFRTEFLSGQSARYGGQAVADYADRSSQLRAAFAQRDGQQEGDPAKLAAAIVHLAGAAAPPLRFAAGADAVGVVETKLAGVRAELDQWRALSTSLGGDYRK
jgi:NAD(P)-dependent dehydrogenase (short-subunit alcohol dehydrogenase family)